MLFRRFLFTPSKITNDILQLPTHELLQQLGYVKQASSGVLHWLPLGLKTLRNIEGIIRRRMDESGAHEVSLSSLSQRSLWETTGRWSNTELFKLKDAKKKDYCLVPTCEEEITWLMNSYLTSYKDLPIIAYQITRKYRDELRPRGGLLRGREFLMKDAYSFHLNSEDAVSTFERVNATYDKIFTDIGVPFVSAVADSGDIGGDLSKEYHFIHESGEDTLFRCNSCEAVSNIEKCGSYPVESKEYLGDVSVKYALNEENDTLVCLYYPASRHLNWNLALEAVDNDLEPQTRYMTNEEVLAKFTENYDPMFNGIIRVMDVRLNSRSNFPDFPLKSYLKNNFAQLNDYSIVDVEEGEICAQCEEGELESAKSIEVGHTFYLGKKYSKALNATFRQQDNSDVVMEMGCYGIGVSRLIGAIAQVTRDPKGLRWPSSVSPYKVSVCASDKSVDQLNKVKALLDYKPYTDFDAKTSIGAKIQQSHALGIPIAIVVGPKSWPNVEIEVRGNFRSKNWETSYEKLHSQLGWEYNQESGKHFVLHENANDVVNILLKDL
ncbi:putative proline--tRNA ligase AIM10 [Kluyveromyces lactis]|uniref:proline--tRNA ligase n=1 Tax=Kluyveromyces lactis (strain ATCC 8585 / CBS 2359 / DSM 70799 / NBRC 1267 / NRRL Y-1140 / WM37) TaxID=284590 RepID=Q6CMJ2_KLULA|nr:uncharacterized protein KLLA0_E19801g [Kluyveromyces lactis]CAG99934.1 KLLA0E19801p [Kluyveromyces lactis]|eukprot:XP_454847.1 uncharacterized protein KLLA0_E19801g [Kluyveromyces lactis]